jgi:hypothetical protein
VVKITDSGVISFKIESIISSRLASVIGGSHTNWITGESVFVVFVGVTIITTGDDVGACIITGLVFGEMIGVNAGTVIAGLLVGIYR